MCELVMLTIFKVIGLIYLIGFIPSMIFFKRMTLEGKMSFDESPPENVAELWTEAFLAATVWPFFLVGFLFEKTPKVVIKK